MNIFNWISFCGGKQKTLAGVLCRVLGLVGFPKFF